MKFSGTLIVLVSILPVAGQAQTVAASAPQPTPLEAFAKQTGSRSTGLVLQTIGVGRFWFPDQDASQLSAAFARAMGQLKQR